MKEKLKTVWASTTFTWCVFWGTYALMYCVSEALEWIFSTTVDKAIEYVEDRKARLKLKKEMEKYET